MMNSTAMNFNEAKFSYLPFEMVEKILMYASEYSPTLKMVSKLWREIISYSGFNKWISFKDLVRRGDVDLLIDLHERRKKDCNRSLLIYAAFYGREELCHLAKRWGGTDFEGMLYAATKGRHENICQIARTWGAKGIDKSLNTLLVEGHEFSSPFFDFHGDYNLEAVFDSRHREVLQSFIKEWESKDTDVLIESRNNPKTGNGYITIDTYVEGKGWRKWMLNSKPRDLLSEGGTIITIY